MDRLENYRTIIKRTLQEYAQVRPVGGTIEMETVFDETRDHYELLALGWQGKRRVHGSIVHIDIKDGKVWLQHDSTDVAFAEQLVENGIPTEQIVLGFQPEQIRQYSGFAVN
jgi:hypothetical protein